MKEFLLTGNGPIANKGCEAIVLGSKSIIEQEFGSSRFILASFANDPQGLLPDNIRPIALHYKRPRWSKAWWKYQASKRGIMEEDELEFMKPLLGQLGNAVAALSIGGDGYAIDYGHEIIDRLIVMDKYMLRLGIPVIVWGASIGPFDQEPDFLEYIKGHLMELNLIVVREPLSLKYLNSLGIVENVSMYPDPAFVLDSVPIDLPDELASFIDAGCIGINISRLLARYVAGGNIEKWEEIAAKIIQGLVNDTGRLVLLIPHVFGKGANEKIDDRGFLKKLHQRFSQKDRKRVAILDIDMNCENLKWVISRLEALVAVRMHATIAAFSTNVPCISIAYSRKAWGLNEMIFEDSRWVLDAEDLSPVSLSRKVSELMEDKESLVSHLECTIPRIKQKAYEAAREIQRVLSV